MLYPRLKRAPIAPPAPDPVAVKIKSSHPLHNGHMIISSADFDPAVHELFDAPAAVLPPPPPPPVEKRGK
jgi:hypothetical protein